MNTLEKDLMGMAGAAPASPIDQMRAEINQLRNERDDWRRRWYRLLPDDEVLVSGDPRGDDYVTESADEDTLETVLLDFISDHADELDELVHEAHMAKRQQLADEAAEATIDDVRGML